MVRTNVVTLKTIPGVAYRQKLPSGGSGIVIIREDCKQPGIASISKTSGEPIPTANTSKRKYPLKAFREAIDLTAGLSYKKQGAVKLKGLTFGEEAPEVIPETAAVAIIVDSADYQKIVDRYTDKNGKFSDALLNKDLTQFAYRSSVVRNMIEDKKSVNAIRKYITGTKFRSITENHELTDKQVQLIVEMLDELDPKGIFKELNAELRRSLNPDK